MLALDSVEGPERLGRGLRKAQRVLGVVLGTSQ